MAVLQGASSHNVSAVAGLSHDPVATEMNVSIYSYTPCRHLFQWLVCTREGFLLDVTHGRATLHKMDRQSLHEIPKLPEHLFIKRKAEGQTSVFSLVDSLPLLTLSMSLSRVPLPGPSSTSWQALGSPATIQSDNTHTPSSCEGGRERR